MCVTGMYFSRVGCYLRWKSFMIIIPWVVGLVLDFQTNGLVIVHVLTSRCVYMLSSIPKAKFDSIRGLPVSSPVWTSYLLISRRACPFRGSPTHQRRFLPGIKKLTSGFTQSLILQITICMMTGPSFYFTLFAWLQKPWLLDIASVSAFKFGRSGGVWTAFIWRPLLIRVSL